MLRAAGGGGGGASDTSGLSTYERQCLQVEKARTRDPNPYFDGEGLNAEMAKWVYPLHFIDFETTQVAIPFNRGMAPYEGIAFQFSHHRVDAEGRIAHVSQYLHGERGSFPSFEFLRALKKDLEGDEGTIFRYADHENTYLNIIYSQLQEADPEEVPDRDEFLGWITTVARPTKGNTDAWVAGKRSMVDLLDLVKRYFYHPATGGSNSLKKVLPPIFDDAEDSDLEHLISDLKLADGAAAMIAYARMQFSEMGEEERGAIEQALLKYCELDTLAMVMLWEYWSKELMAD